MVGSGENIDYDRLRQSIYWADIVVAVDGGYNHIRKLNLKADLIIGDFDSLNAKYLYDLEFKKLDKLKFPSEKNSTDMELAIDHLNSLGASEIILMGASGSRLDHTNANVFLLKKLLDYGIKGYIEDKNNRIYMTNTSLSLEKVKNEYVSVIPVGFEGARVSLLGFKYPLDNYFIDFASSIGISNEVKDKRAQVKVHSGFVLVYVSKD